MGSQGSCALGCNDHFCLKAKRPAAPLSLTLFCLTEDIGSMVRFEFEALAEEHLFLECAVCLLPWSDPRELKPCGHIFCSRCVRSTPQCPVCRSPVGSMDTPNRVLLNVLSSLRGSCSFCPSWAGTREQFASHLTSCHRGQEEEQPSHRGGGGSGVDGNVDLFACIPVWEDYDMGKEEYLVVCRAFQTLLAAKQRTSQSPLLAFSQGQPSAAGSNSGVIGLSESDVYALTLHLNIHVTAKEIGQLLDRYQIKFPIRPPMSSPSASASPGVELHQILFWIGALCKRRDPTKEYGPGIGRHYKQVLQVFDRLDPDILGTVRTVETAREIAEVASGQPANVSDVSRALLCAKQATILSASKSSCEPLVAVVRDGATLHELLVALESSGEGWDLTDGHTPLDARKAPPPPAPQSSSTLNRTGSATQLQPTPSVISSSLAGHPAYATAPPLTPPGSTVRDRPSSIIGQPQPQPQQYLPTIVHQTAQQPNYGASYPATQPAVSMQHQYPPPNSYGSYQPSIVHNHHDPNRPTTAGYLQQATPQYVPGAYPQNQQYPQYPQPGQQYQQYPQPGQQYPGQYPAQQQQNPAAPSRSRRSCNHQ